MKCFLTITIAFMSIIFLLNAAHAQITPGSLWVLKKGDASGLTFTAVYGDKRVADAVNTPAGRKLGASWKDSKNNLWFFGSGDNVSFPYRYYHDLWKYIPSANEWVWMNGDSAANKLATFGDKGIPAAGNTPGARSGAVSWIDGADNLWLFGRYGFLGEKLFLWVHPANIVC